jgi:hypothetical protein
MMCAQHHRHLISGPKTVYGNISWKNIHMPYLLRYFFIKDNNMAAIEKCSLAFGLMVLSNEPTVKEPHYVWEPTWLWGLIYLCRQNL